MNAQNAPQGTERSDKGMNKGIYSPVEMDPIEPRSWLESALADAEADYRQAVRTAERIASTRNGDGLAVPCTDMLLTSLRVQRLKEMASRTILAP